ncbi:hypothetical protein PAXRUDRAFT_830844 [Paxillus rubicundulus Ve08.2h10]|uniref:Uncharacterized protein n=1 Tax=Paxillus rubicundulus Ve08.2h10 TaxID=930991 RepID=A0A0D0D4K4_9AGAM|nr:hypothetical protein PAXRUDRAFT_830844 [Paxillus rubicundulus Ve08.2h10]
MIKAVPSRIEITSRPSITSVLRDHIFRSRGLPRRVPAISDRGSNVMSAFVRRAGAVHNSELLVIRVLQTTPKQTERRRDFTKRRNIICECSLITINQIGVNS